MEKFGQNMNSLINVGKKSGKIINGEETIHKKKLFELI